MFRSIKNTYFYFEVLEVVFRDSHFLEKIGRSPMYKITSNLLLCSSKGLISAKYIWCIYELDGKLPSKIPWCCFTLNNSPWVLKSNQFYEPQGARQQIERNHPESYLSFPDSLTIDRLLVVGVHKVPWVLNGILEVPDSMWTVPLTPHPFLSCFRLLLTFRKPVLLRTGTWKRKNKCG